ncbi:MAG: Fe-S cluster assembly protein SufD [Flavobacteriaceae bacterium]|nr:Fe-S cluster assembly protein SufD [Flavobacteriaceae bacterium]MCY4217256.1 Fe-S cluster assembly protein SufD [Flavobacteriaceae bacterium]MCY4268067.1 Fe-S cluster assembly protein SufD [Flavobacteriaceae bacterium]MCY4299028.1 Fe-S cluster assembly protein SufD [Flavobacteriaceae bacterium]
MEFKEKLLSSFFALQEAVLLDDNPLIEDRRNQAFKTFEEKGFPTRQQEAWKYTSLSPLLSEDYVIFPSGDVGIHPNDVKKYFLYEMDTYKIVFIDGVYSPFLSNTHHDGFDVNLFSVALNQKQHRRTIDTYFNTIAPSGEPLVALNTAYAHEGAYIYIPKNKAPQSPIEILHFSSGDSPALWLQPRNLIVVEQGSEAQIIERHQSLVEHPVVTNSVTEIYAGKNASIEYYKIQDDLDSASLIDSTFIHQETHSHVSVHTSSLGGKIIRNNLNFHQAGKAINSTLKGITVLEGNQHVDHSTLVHHAQPHCESHQDYKGIFRGSSQGVFNGKILVDRMAQKTNAFQQNNNIILSDKAVCNAKPQLEIFADDVRCSHGCTVGQLDQNALFYAQSRGIPIKEAEALLTYAFANNVLESVSIPFLKKHISLQIASKFGVEMGFGV